MATKIKLAQIEDGATLKELVEWYKKNKVNFVHRFNALRKKTREAFKKAGYSFKDIDKLISAVRSKSGNK